MFKNLKYVPFFITIIFIAGILFILNNKVKFIGVATTDFNGTAQRINLPFKSLNDSVCNTVYEIGFKNSLLFSGEIQVIPDDCLLKIWLNSDTVPSFLYTEYRCDYSNGFYLNLTKYLKENNKLWIEVSNSDGNYGLDVRDTTHYEIFMVIWAIICFFPLIIISFRKNIKLNQVSTLIRKYRNTIIVFISLSGFFFTVMHSLLLFNSRVEFLNTDGTLAPMQLPCIIDQKDSLTFNFRLTIQNYFFFPTPIRFISGGEVRSLKINGTDAVSLINQNNLNHWKGEISRTLKQFLNTGKNEIDISINNSREYGNGVFIFKKNNCNIFVYFLYLLLFISPLLFRIYKDFALGIFIVPLFSFSILIWMMYASTLSYNNYSHDINGHIQYINYLYEKGHIPVSSGGWSFYHPPLYYITSAFVWHVANIFGIQSDLEIRELLQIFSVLLFVIYSFFSLKTLDLIFKINLKKLEVQVPMSLQAILYLTILSLFLFWPSNVIHSMRIGNDILFYTFYSIAFYFIIKWYNLKDFNYLILSLLFSSMATWTKTNGLMLFGIIGILFVYNYLFDTDRIKKGMEYLLKLLLIAGFAFVTLYFAFYEKINSSGKNNSEMIVGNESKIPQTLKIDNKFTNFITLNPKQFVKETYTNTVDDAKGRQYFWHYLFKTSLFGEFSFERPVTKQFAVIVNIFFLFLLPIILTGIILSVLNFRSHAPFMVSIIILLGSMIFLRIVSPYSSANDFRFIFPAITLFSYFIGITGFNALKKNTFLFFVIVLIPCLFILFSILFQTSFII